MCHIEDIGSYMNSRQERVNQMSDVPMKARSDVSMQLVTQFWSKWTAFKKEINRSIHKGFFNLFFFFDND